MRGKKVFQKYCKVILPFNFSTKLQPNEDVNILGVSSLTLALQMTRTGITLLLLIGMPRFAHNYRATWAFQGGASG